MGGPEVALSVKAPTPSPPQPRARGIDVSSWNHGGGKLIDWAKVRAAGYTFAMIKATQGNFYTNPYLVDDFHGAHGAGLIVGAYHFYVVGVPPAEQADYFGKALEGHTTELGCYLDWEPGEVNQFEAKQLIDEFVTEGHKYRNPIGLYTGQWWYAQLKSTGLVPARLWLADWSNEPLPQGVTIVQRSAAVVDGIEGETDIDELLSIRGINVPRPPAAAEEPFTGPHPSEADLAAIRAAKAGGEEPPEATPSA